ncbi:MAG TPA: hypothetical protein VFO41_13420 [Alphaproteobacteria bacterium]|nr:hypothetical protein [Alphaproteobacteria bacterium]
MSNYDPSYDFDYRQRRRRESPFATDTRRTGRRFWAYLRTRPAECWFFFAAGAILATLLG